MDNAVCRYFAGRRNDVFVVVSEQIGRIDFPQQPFDFQFDLPFSIYGQGDDKRAEQYQSQNRGHYNRTFFHVVFPAQFVVETATGFVFRPIDTGPFDRQIM